MADARVLDELQAPERALLDVIGLVKHFPLERRPRARNGGPVRAVDGLRFWIERGNTLGLVGESGSGKTTAGRAILRLIEPTAGTVRFNGEDVLGLDAADLQHFRRKAQIVFQDPYSTLNPRLTVAAALGEVLAVHGLARGNAARERIAELLLRVGLSERHAGGYPHEFSGGQRQRIGIARALAVEPEFIVCDEPVSALDVSVQAQVLNLLRDLQRELGLTYLFISHDLGVVSHMSDRIAVMYRGRIVEIGPATALLGSPLHPYTRALLSAVPRAEVRSRVRPQTGAPGGRGRIELSGDAPGPAQPAVGCPFYPRCPHAEKDEACRQIIPLLAEKRPNQFAACIKESPAGVA